MHNDLAHLTGFISAIARINSSCLCDKMLRQPLNAVILKVWDGTLRCQASTFVSPKPMHP